jgi:Na+-translocating ferredoxin:NAD+ oxidoreductase RnfD subunit
MHPLGKIIFGVGCGVLTMVIRLWAGYPEGVSFAVLLMNATVPILDMYTRPKKFGTRRFAAEEGGL